MGIGSMARLRRYCAGSAMRVLSIAIPAWALAAEPDPGATGSSAASQASASATKPDKSAYTLLNPTPAELMREFNTDRPDKTETPYTVDAGHIQIELDLVTWTHDHPSAGGVTSTTEEYDIVPTNFKVGLTNTTDVQLIVEPYIHQWESTLSTSNVQDGFGDTLVRLKQNLFGNDGGDVALGVMPFVKFPTNTGGVGNNSMEGGIIVPVDFHLPGGFELGAQTELDFSRNSLDEGHHQDWINSITLHHDLIPEKLNGYVEFWSNLTGEPGTSWIGTVDFGVQYTLEKNLLWDVGANLGVTPSAPDLNLFTGLSMRF